MDDSKEYFWGCQLSKDSPTMTWGQKEKEDEDENDSDFLNHTLFLRHAVLGVSAVKSERSVIEIETTSFEGNKIKQPLLSLTLGQNDMCNLDVSFSDEFPVTLTLIEGTGPVCITGTHLTEFPPEDDLSQDESALDTDGDLEEDEDDEEEMEDEVTTKKRKAPAAKTGKTKKGRIEPSSEDESLEDEDDEEEDDEEEDMEEEDIESSPEKPKKKGKKGKEPEKKTKAAAANKAKAKKASGGKKAGKK